MPKNAFLLKGPQFPPIKPDLPSKLTIQGSTTCRVLDIALPPNDITNLIFELSTGVIIPISGRIAFERVLMKVLLNMTGKKRHYCAIIHWVSIDNALIQDSLKHNEQEEIKLVWRIFDQLKQKPLYPEGILDFLIERKEPLSHLVIRKSYDE